MEPTLSWIKENAQALSFVLAACVALGGLVKWLHSQKKAQRENSKIHNPPPSHVATFYYLSARRIESVYDQLPPKAFRSKWGRRYRWAARAELDTPGDLGAREDRLRTSQRQLAIIMNHWDRTGGYRSLADALASGRELDPNQLYVCEPEFRVEPGKPTEPLMAVTASVDGFRLVLECSKDGFPALSRSREDGPFEANSGNPDFFRGTRPMRLFALVECRSVDREQKTIVAGALCLAALRADGGQERQP